MLIAVVKITTFVILLSNFAMAGVNWASIQFSQDVDLFNIQNLFLYKRSHLLGMMSYKSSKCVSNFKAITLSI